MARLEYDENGTNWGIGGYLCSHCHGLCEKTDKTCRHCGARFEGRSMKYIIEVEDNPYSNGQIITDNGQVVHEIAGDLLYRVVGIPYLAFTAEELAKLEPYEEG